MSPTPDNSHLDPLRDVVAEEPAIIVSRRGGVAILTLNRPKLLNAINEAVRGSIPKLFEDLAADADVRCVVIHGAGPRAFCVGGEIGEKLAPEAPIDTRTRMVRRSFSDAIEAFPKPTIAAVHGFCLGGGLEMALACDIRIASPDAVFGLPEVNLGLIPAAGGTQRLPRLVGLARALDMVLTAERIDAAQALRIGLITRVTPEGGTVLDAALALADGIAARPPAAMAAAKEAVRTGAVLDPAAGLRLEKDLYALLLLTEDRLEAAAAFREKRPPVFTGR